MGYSIDMRLDGRDQVSRALADAQPVLRDETVPVMQDAAEKIAAEARSSARPYPSGLWRSRSGRALRPDYRVAKKGRYWVRVATPGTAAGRAEATSEFARRAVTGQGAAMVRALGYAYGRAGGSGGGRILWAAADRLADSVVSDIDAAVAKAAGRIEKKMGGA